MKKISAPGYPYTFDPEACRICSGRCCSGESGYIWVDEPELTAIAEFLGVCKLDFIREYLRRVDNRWSLCERIEGRQNVCLFFDMHERKCTVYEVRPHQCRRFPFWEYYRDRVDVLQKEYPGVQPDCG